MRAGDDVSCFLAAACDAHRIFGARHAGIEGERLAHFTRDHLARCGRAVHLELRTAHGRRHRFRLRLLDKGWPAARCATGNHQREGHCDDAEAILHFAPSWLMRSLLSDLPMEGYAISDRCRYRPKADVPP